LGLLLIDDEIGDFYDAMRPYYERIYETARLNKITRVQELAIKNEIKQLSQIASSNTRFELKFKYINFTNNLIYRELVDTYFNFPKVRFCALVVDRLTYINKTNQGKILNPWDVYIHQAAMLLANNIKEITPCNVCILADDLSRPRNIEKSFERSLKDAIEYRLRQKSIPESVFGVSRLESHSSLLLQVVDILLGGVMFDFKLKEGMIAEKLKQRQEPVTQKIRERLHTKSLAMSTTFHKPNYFSIWKLKA